MDRLDRATCDPRTLAFVEYVDAHGYLPADELPADVSKKEKELALVEVLIRSPRIGVGKNRGMIAHYFGWSVEKHLTVIRAIAETYRKQQEEAI
jgi:hypothetical protein